MADIGVDLGVLKAFLQVIVNSLIANLADQRQIRYADLLLLRAFEDRFLDLGFAAPAPAEGLAGAGVFLAPGALRDRLDILGQLGTWRAMGRMRRDEVRTMLSA